MTHQEIYRGWLVLRSNGEEDDILHLSSNLFRAYNEILLAETITDHICAYGSFLSVRYYLTDKEISEDQLVQEFKLYTVKVRVSIECVIRKSPGIYGPMNNYWLVGTIFS